MTITLQKIEEAADDIAAILSHNASMQVLNLGNNKLQTKGIIENLVFIQL